MIRLGVNIDHIATLRNARGGQEPDPVQAALLAEIGGADNITCHLREDRRHINDRDLRLIRETIKTPLNLEMAATPEMVEIAIKTAPHSVTLVPERREERTTEGGLDLKAHFKSLYPIVQNLQAAGIVVSLFVEPNSELIAMAKQLGVKALEFHTGRFALEIAAARTSQEKAKALEPLQLAAWTASQHDLQIHVGHGLHYTNVHFLKQIPSIEEANIGHAIITRALYVGLKDAVSQMREALGRGPA